MTIFLFLFFSCMSYIADSHYCFWCFVSLRNSRDVLGMDQLTQSVVESSQGWNSQSVWTDWAHTLCDLHSHTNNVDRWHSNIGFIIMLSYIIWLKLFIYHFQPPTAVRCVWIMDLVKSTCWVMTSYLNGPQIFYIVGKKILQISC